MDKSTSPRDVFGKTLFAYTRAQALNDGMLVDVSTMAQQAGFRWPVAMTRTAWEDCVAWTPTDNHHQVYQDASGRLWDALWMAFTAIRSADRNAPEILFRFCRVPRDGKTTQSSLTLLKLVAGPGDAGEPVITIMLPNED